MIKKTSISHSFSLINCTSSFLFFVKAAELTWHEEVFHGEWIKEESAGGSGLKKQPPGVQLMRNVV